jgi:lipopolysaccharide transport system ATP-binding protein
MKPAIRAENLSKRYRLRTAGMGRRVAANLTEALVGGALTTWDRIRGKRSDVSDFWALSDVSFEVQPGEVVGIIGRNGAGKSTLLKILSRIVEPTTGRAEVRGRMGSLLEVGTGFHPELTGRENVFLNGSILGMSRHEIARKFDEIVAFSEIEPFLDTPVKRYSSGMYVRLAFAVAAHLEPEILIVDEVLAVGDAAFQAKCLETMRSVARSGRTVLVVSHQLDVIQRLCSRTVWLDGGKVAATGSAPAVVADYLAQACQVARAGDVIDLSDVSRIGNGAARFVHLACSDGAGRPPHTNGSLVADLQIDAARALIADSLAVTLYDPGGYKLVNADTVALARPIALPAGRTAVRLTIRAVPLNPGRYRLGLWLARRPGTVFDHIDHAADLELFPDPTRELSPRADCDGVVACDFDLDVLS